jgi:hypothetical protein
MWWISRALPFGNRTALAFVGVPEVAPKPVVLDFIEAASAPVAAKGSPPHNMLGGVPHQRGKNCAQRGTLNGKWGG